jgi:hypothetical protein
MQVWAFIQGKLLQKDAENPLGNLLGKMIRLWWVFHIYVGLQEGYMFPNKILFLNIIFCWLYIIPTLSHARKSHHDIHHSSWWFLDPLTPWLVTGCYPHEHPDVGDLRTFFQGPWSKS